MGSCNPTAKNSKGLAKYNITVLHNATDALHCCVFVLYFHRFNTSLTKKEQRKKHAIGKSK